MNKCPKCGTKLIGSAKFCPMCVKKWKEIKPVTIPTKEIQEKGEIQMNKCPKCGTEFEGKFCPECGSSPTGERLCPNCKALVPSDAKFCKECGFTLTPQVQPPVKKRRNNAAAVWIKAHKKLLGWGAAALALVLILSIVIPVSVINRHNGTYYLYSNEEYDYEKYFIFKGNTYTDETGYSCDVKFHGENVELYAELFGIKDVMARGTINGDVLKLEIMGTEVTYAMKGHIHNLKDEVIKEATCEEEGSSISSCYCGYRAKEPKTVPALGHDFGKDHLCKRCGTGNGVLLEFALNQGESSYSVKGIGECKDNVIIIPSEYKGLPVTAIGGRAFQHCDGLTSINIPDSVTLIGSEAFYDCDGLTSINIPDSVTLIGSEAFYSCSWLTSVTIGSGVTAIGEGAFYKCRGLTSINIPDSVTSIGGEAFFDCDGLTSINIPDSVTSIGPSAFAGCSGLTKMNVDEKNQTYHAQWNCVIETKSKTLIAGCKTSKIPDDGSVTSIGAEGFAECDGLTSVTIPNSVTSIGKEAFTYCLGLTSVTIGNGVTSIGNYAFFCCRGLTSVKIGSGVTSIGEHAFGHCDNLKEVHFENPNGWKVSENRYMSNAEVVSGLEDPAKAAQYLTNTYSGSYWEREG